MIFNMKRPYKHTGYWKARYVQLKPLIGMLLAVLLTAGAQAQCILLSQPDGKDSTYGTYRVFTTSTGAVSTGGTSMCGGPPLEYRPGPFAPGGSYIFTFSKPVYSLYISFWVLNGTEYMRCSMNGSFYPITTANMTAYTECDPGPTSGPCYLSAGEIFGPGTVSDYNGGDFEVHNCNGINTFEIFCNGTVGGVAFHICFDSVPPTYCVRAFSDGVVCEGTTAHLWCKGDSAGATYLWTGPGGYSSTVKNPFITPVTLGNTGLYTVTKTVGTLTFTDTVSLYVKPTPVITASYNSPLCYGIANTLNLFAGPLVSGETFLWSGPGGFSSVLQNPTRVPLADIDTGVYTVTGSLNGCSRSTTLHVVYTPVPPAPVISGTTPYCTGQAFVPFSVAGAGGSSVLWYPAAVGGTGSSTAPTVNTTVAGVTTVWATQTVSGCESPRGSFVTTVNTTPAPPAITGATTYCQFDTYVPPTATGTAILWYTTPTGGTGTATPPAVSTATPGAHTIYATQTTTGCESPRGPFTITVNVKPTPPVITDFPDVYCPGQPFVPFTVVSGIGILWYTGPSGGTGSPVAPILSTGIPGPQTVYASQTVLGCESDRSSYTITVADSVKALFDPIIKRGCKADTVMFVNKSKQTTTYAWHFGDGFSSIQKNPTHVYLVQALDTVKLYASVATCIDSSIQEIDLRHPLHAYFKMDTNLICQGGTVNFSDSSSVGSPGFTYLWMYGDGDQHVPITTPTTSYTYLVSGVYHPRLIVTDSIPCTDTMYKTLYVDTVSPISVVLTDTVLCKGTYVTMTGIFAKVGNSGLTWDLGNADSIKTNNPLVYGYTNAGTYTITARAYYRVCPDTYTTRKITVVDQPTVDLGGAELSVCKGGKPLIITDNQNANNNLASWEWSTGDKTSSITVVAPGVYTTTVRIHGCYASATVVVKNDCYMNIPNVFTPNGDGENDYFYPRQYLTSGLVAFKMSIYNRWGQTVFETTSLDGKGWDGKLNDIPQPQEVYVYVIDGTFKDGQHEHHQGNITLLR